MIDVLYKERTALAAKPRELSAKIEAGLEDSIAPERPP